VLRPEDDLENRKPVWSALQMLFMDTDVAGHLDEITEVCSSSPYALDELEEILFQEILPALRGNLFDVAGEWRGYDRDALARWVLSKHRFGKRRPWGMRAYAQEWWGKIRPEIDGKRSRRDSS